MKAFSGFVFVVLSLCLLTNAAHAQGNVVMLGLRSIEGDDDFANSLTSAMREQARQIETWAVSDRAVSLSQMSLAYGCEELDASCLSEITAGLEADAVVYGTVQRTSARDDFDYNVTINLFSAETGAITNTVNEVLPSSDLPPGELAMKAKRLLMKLAGMGTTRGSIFIRANVQTADVIVDGNPAGAVENGVLLIDEVSPGAHTVQIVGSDYQPFSELVNVAESEQSTVLAILRMASGEEPLIPYDTEPGEKGPSLEWLGWTLVGVSGGFVVGTVVSWFWIDSIDSDPKFNDYRRRVGESDPTVKDVCDQADLNLRYALPGTTAHSDFDDVKSMCGTADALEVLQYVFLGSAVVAGGVGTYLLITESGSDSRGATLRTPSLAIRPRIGTRASMVTATITF